jgi:hypothetical protein
MKKDKHKSSTREKENEERWNEEDMEFDLRFTLILQCGFHQNINILLQQP